jgi:hypothetical protein
MTPPSPLFPCTSLGMLVPGPHGIPCRKPTHRHSHLARAHQPVIPSGARALSSLILRFGRRAPKALVLYLFGTFLKHVSASLPLRAQYIVLRHIPRTRPSGVTIYLSSRPNTGDHSVSGGHA